MQRQKVCHFNLTCEKYKVYISCGKYSKRYPNQLLKLAKLFSQYSMPQFTLHFYKKKCYFLRIDFGKQNLRTRQE